LPASGGEPERVHDRPALSPIGKQARKHDQQETDLKGPPVVVLTAARVLECAVQERERLKGPLLAQGVEAALQQLGFDRVAASLSSRAVPDLIGPSLLLLPLVQSRIRPVHLAPPPVSLDESRQLRLRVVGKN